MIPSRLDLSLKMSTEETLKKKVLQSAEAIKKKVKLIRDMKMDNDIMMESVLKPITEPLNEMVKSKNKYMDGTDDEDKHKWETSVKKLKFDPYKEKSKGDYNNTFVVKKTSDSSSVYDNCESDTENAYDDDESNSSENTNHVNEMKDNSFKTSDSFASPRDDPAFQKYSNTFESIPFGVRMERDKLMLGSHLVLLKDTHLKVNGCNYKLTPGLNELLFKKTPNLNIITEDDKRNYKILLLETNAHRRDFNPNKPIKSNKGKKYLYIIKPLFKLSKPRTISSASYSKGQGLPTMKKVKSAVSYVYWDNPNELVDRLKLLIASRDAGNTGLDNEIISIVEELKESGIIK